MKRTDIDKRFTEKVAEYLADGYTINTSTMGGSQGEICKVDLTKGEEVLRIWMSRESSREMHPRLIFNYVIAIRVGMWCCSASDLPHHSTIWMSDLKTIEEEVYYEVDREKWYVESIEEVNEIKELQKNRCYRKFVNKEHVTFEGDAYNTIASNYLKNHKDYQRVSKGDITVSKEISDYYGVSYHIYYRGHDYRLK